MKISGHTPLFRSGTALVIVLASLIFLSALALAFLAGVSTELKSSKAYADGTAARILADSAANLVMAQIKTATSGTSGSGDLAWASQPGMIRTYDDQGALHRAYKLYSSRDWVMTNAVDAAAESAALANWREKPAHFTDLNAPASGQYPILDPGAEGVVEGFSFSSLPAGMAKGEMPVEWLYVLKNGDIVPPDAAASATQTAIVPGATKDNPIVGRMAFWADDETAKVNINTASEGTFWDTPRVVSLADKQLAKYQPAKNEFQRYPGHPAMTSLKTALPTISSPAMAYRLSPRIADGGSITNGVYVSGVTAPVSLDKDRLYSTVDELMFDPDRNTQGLSKEDLERSRFFVTASSRAPEVNLFNKPRVALWPLHQNTADTYRSVADRLIAFCSTINGNPYYFQRSDPHSATVDFAIERNRQLFSYLQDLTARSIPGFGGDFEGKYDDDRNQILTEIFDYIRCANINDQTVANPYAPSGQIVPIRTDSNTMGFGRFPLVQELGIVFVRVGTGKKTSAPVADAVPVDSRQFPPYPGIDGNGTPPDNTPAIQAFVTMSFLVPGQGWPAYLPDFTVQIDGLNAFRLSNSTGLPAINLGFPATGTTRVRAPVLPSGQLSLPNYIPWGGVLDPRLFVYKKEFAGTGDKRFPFFSNIIDLPVPWDFTMGFSGGPLTVRIYAGDSTSPSNLVQTVSMRVPDSGFYKFKIPTLSRANYRLIGAAGEQSPAYNATPNPNTSTTVYDRFDLVNNQAFDGQNICQVIDYDKPSGGRFDTAVSVFVASGDPRITLRPSVSESLYGVRTDKWQTSLPTGTNLINFANIYSFSYNVGLPFTGAAQGKLVTQAEYSNDRRPSLSAAISHAYVNGDPALTDGDWDNAVASCNDGAFINKVDEGNVAGMSVGKIPYYNDSYSYQPSPLSYFSANRQMPSAGMLGSLPTGIKAGLPWRTLLFRPDLSGNHPGGDSPADHLMMDLFWMPIVEPYPLSEPFSTAGKVNMNCQIMPFSFIKRETALRAVLKSERLLAVPQKELWSSGKLKGHVDYKDTWEPDSWTWPDYRLNLDLDETLKGFQNRFAANDLFRSSSEICEISLVPKTPDPNAPDISGQTTYADVGDFWDKRKLTGDDSRERPYTNLYPRLTTKSNTFTVHSRVQTLQNRPGDPADQWTEGRGRITGEYRGSTLIERYIDPNDTRIPDYATASNPEPLDRFYKFRVPGTKQFNP